MTDISRSAVLSTDGKTVKGRNTDARMRRRYAAEKRFRLYGLVAISLAMAALFWLLASITASGYQAFVQTYIQLEISFDASAIDPKGTRDRQTLRRADYAGLYKSAIREAFPEVHNRRDRRDLTRLISSGADLQLRDMVLSDPSIIGTRQKVWLVAADEVDQFAKGAYDPKKPESERPFKDKEIAWFDALKSAGALEKRFNWSFLTSGTSREPELAGIWGAIVGSFWTMLVTLVLSFPVGVAAAIYLQEFAPKNRWTDLIEVNINNLAAVPSIVFGLLGLAVFLNFLGLPRSAPMAGGKVLDHHRDARRPERGAAVDPRSRARGRRLAPADGTASRAAAGASGHPDRHDHRHGARARRDRAPPDDRDGRVHRRHSGRPDEPVDGAAGTDLPVERPAGTRVRRTDERRDPGASGFPDRDERDRHPAAQEVRTALVGRKTKKVGYGRSGRI